MELIDIKEVARVLGVSVRLAWRLRDSGKLPAEVRIPSSRLVKFRRSDIENWIADGCPDPRRVKVQKVGA